MHTSLYEQLYLKLASDIRKGLLVADTKLPSVRKYAEENGISINTVLGAYNLLLSEGYIYSKEKKGYFVASFEDSLPEDKPKPIQAVEKQDKLNKIDLIDLSSNLVDSTLFPYGTLKRLYREALSGDNLSLLEQAGNYKGELDLRKSIANYVYNHKAIVCSPDQIIIGNGNSTQLQALPKLFKKQSVFLLEKPGFTGTYEVIKDTGKTIISIPLEEDGVSLNAIKTACNNLDNCVALLHVSPSHQFPMGITMTAPKRTSIIKWATEADNRYIIEDDYDSDFRYNGHPISSLMSMDTQQKVIYLGTFSRTLTPSLRISYMILPSHLLPLYEQSYSKYPCPVSRIDQKVVSLFIDNGFFERHIRCMRRSYKAKRNALLDLFAKLRPDVQIKGEEAGLHFIAHFPEGEKAIIDKAHKAGFILHGTGNGWVIIGYAHLTEEQIQNISILIKK